MRAVTHADDPGRAAAHFAHPSHRYIDEDAVYDREVADLEDDGEDE